MAPPKAAAPERADGGRSAPAGADKTRQQSATVAVGSRQCGAGSLPLQHSTSSCSAPAPASVARVGDCVQVNQANQNYACPHCVCRCSERAPFGNRWPRELNARVHNAHASQVKWDTIWAPHTNGWSIGIVTCVSDGRAKNPNGRGVVTRGWSIVQYEGMYA